MSPDGLRVYTAGDPTEPDLGAVVLSRNSPEGEIRIWDAATGRATRPPIRHRGQISGLALSPDGTWLAAALGTSTLVWNLREYRALQLPRGTNSQVVLLPGTPAQPGAEPEARLPAIPAGGKGAREGVSPVCLAFSPDSGRLLLGYDDLSGAVWSLPDGKRLQLQLSKRPPQLPRSSYPESVAFSADGHRAFLADSEGVVRVWDAQTGESEGQLEKRGDRTLRLGPDGRLAFLSGQVWDLHDGKPLSPAPLHWSWHDAAFSPDGARVLTAGTDGTVRLWDLAGRTPAIRPLKHDWSAVLTNQYHPDGPQTVTMREEIDRALLSSLPGSVRGWFSPDGSRILSVSENGSARVWEARTGEPITPFMFIGKPCATAAFSPDARRIATTGGYSNDGVARVWDGVTGAPITPVINYPEELKSAVLTPNQEWLVTTTEEGTQLWDARDGRETVPTFTHGTQPRCLAFSQDGRFLALCARSGKSTNSLAAETKPSFPTMNGNWETRIYDARTYAPVTPRLSETNPVVEMEFSPDGCWLVTLTVDANAKGPRGPNSMKVARLWDTRTGEPVSEPIPTLFGPIVTFAREKSLVIILRFSGNPVVWDLPKRRALNLTQWRGLNLHPSAITSDGERIAKATGPQVSVYDAVTAEPITPPLEIRTQPDFNQVRFSPDGTSLLVAAGDRVQLFPLPVEKRSVETVGALAKLLAGREIDSSGFYARLSFAEAASLWQTLRPQYPEDFGTSSTQRRYWHEDVLDLAEAQNRWLCAVLHLGQLLLEFPNDAELSLRRVHATDQAALEQLK